MSAKTQELERIFALAGLAWDPILVSAVRDIAAKGFHAADPRPAPPQVAVVGLLFALRGALFNQPTLIDREAFKRLAMAVFDLKGSD